MSLHATTSDEAISPSDPEWNLRDRIRKCRELLDLNQHQFADLIGEDNSTISKWERGSRRPNLEQMLRIEAAAPVPKGFVLDAAIEQTTRDLGYRPSTWMDVIAGSDTRHENGHSYEVAEELAA